VLRRVNAAADWDHARRPTSFSDVPELVACRLLKPLGNPPLNGIKFIAAADVVERIHDRAWLSKLTNAVNQRRPRQNARKKNRRVGGFPDGQCAQRCGPVSAKVCRILAGGVSQPPFY
jgi:hypothetical protein